MRSWEKEKRKANERELKEVDEREREMGREAAIRKWGV